MDEIVIPSCLQITLDDVGWINGFDDRKNGGPSRTGIKRKHCLEDYKAIERLGRALNMDINCAFVIAEWDPDNRLSKIENLSKYGDKWDNRSYIDTEKIYEIADFINSSEKIDIAIHGLMHGYYIDGTDNKDMSDYYYRINKELFRVDDDTVRRKLDAFLDILSHYKINRKINSFVPPSFTYKFNDISAILKDYGIDFISTIFKTMEGGNEGCDIADVENGIINVDRKYNVIDWDTLGGDYENLSPTFGFFGAHWPNILHIEPECNFENTDRAIKFFLRCKNTFGIILSENMSFCATQALYKRFADTHFENSEFVIDASAVPDAKAKKDSFFISAKKPIQACIGGKISLYEELDGFLNYKITPEQKKIILR